MTTRVLYVARHGETHWNAEGRWQGHTDIPLNDVGRSQAHALVPILRPYGVGAVVSSDLARARETAHIVAKALGVGAVFCDPNLRERSFGVFEGLTREECAEAHAEAWSAWQTERRVPHGAESHENLVARVVAAAERAALQAATDGAPAFVVTHGGSLRALVHAVTGQLPPPVKNTEVWRVTYAGRFVEARPLPLSPLPPP